MANAITQEDWLNRLRPGETPVFRHTRAALLAYSGQRDELTARDLALPVLADPLATLRLIYAANNRSSRRLGTEIATVEHAIMMQGVGVFLEQARALPVLEDIPLCRDKACLDSIYRLLRLSQHAAWQARDFAVLHTDVRAEEVLVAALLYYAPEFLFWLQAPEEARRLALLRRRLPSAEAEKEALGFELAPLRLTMLDGWKIPDVIRDMLDDRYAERPRRIILKSCLEIAHLSRHGWWDERLAEAYLALAGVVNLPLEEVTATVHANAVRAARFGAWIPATPAAAWLVLEPGPWPEEPRETEEAAAPQPAPQQPRPGQSASAPERPRPAAPAAAPAAPDKTPPRDKTAIPARIQADSAVFMETLRNIENHLDGSLTLNQMVALILKGLHNGLGLSRILFAMVTPDGKRVKSRFTLGVPSGDPLRHFEFALGGKDLFAQLMSKTQGVWVNTGNREKLWPMLTPANQVMVGKADFLAMSLHTGTKPFGLIYADQGQNDSTLDNHTYTDFKMFCLQAVRGLSKLKNEG